MAIAVHVGVGVSRRLAHQVQRVLPTEAVENGHQDKESDQDAVADEFVRNDGLNEQGQKRISQNLREGYDIQLFEILRQLVVVVTGTVCIRMPTSMAIVNRISSMMTMALKRESQSVDSRMGSAS